MIIISTYCTIRSIGIHYLRVESYIVYRKGFKLIQRGLGSWGMFLLGPMNRLSNIPNKEKATL